MTGLHHVALPTAPAQVEAEVSFWELLGFLPVDPPESLRDRATWLQAGDGTQIHLLYASESEPRAGHVAIVSATGATALRAAGHPVEDRTPHWGSPRAYAHSPGGHLVELMTAPPSS